MNLTRQLESFPFSISSSFHCLGIFSYVQSKCLRCTSCSAKPQEAQNIHFLHLVMLGYNLDPMNSMVLLQKDCPAEGPWPLLKQFF